MRKRHFRKDELYRIEEMRFALLRLHEDIAGQKIKFLDTSIGTQYADGFIRWSHTSLPQVRIVSGLHAGKKIIGLPEVRLKKIKPPNICICEGLIFPHRPGSKGCLS